MLLRCLALVANRGSLVVPRRFRSMASRAFRLVTIVRFVCQVVYQLVSKQFTITPNEVEGCKCIEKPRCFSLFALFRQAMASTRHKTANFFRMSAGAEDTKFDTFESNNPNPQDWFCLTPSKPPTPFVTSDIHQEPCSIAPRSG